MAEKTLKTRIVHRYIEWANYATYKSIVPKQGELVIISIPATTDDTGAVISKPAVLFKVGDGTTTLENLEFMSALAADVYDWAKAASKPSYSASEVSATAPSGYTGSTVQALIEALATKIGTKADSGAISDAISSAIGNLDVAEVGGSGKYISAIKEVDGKITATATTLPTTLKNPYALTINGTSYDGSATKTVTIDKSSIGLGSVSNKSLDSTVTSGSGNYITSGAVKTYVDAQISGLTTFDIQVVTSLPTTGTKGVIYLIAHSHGDKDVYDEYIWNTAASTPAFEKIGNTDVDLSGYVAKATTVAGVDLQDNITASELRTALNVADGATKVTTDTVSGWGFTKNTGTVTGVKINGTAGSISSGVVDLGSGFAKTSDIPSSLKNPYALTVGSKTYNGSAAVTIAKSDLGLGNVDNTADSAKNVNSAKTLTTARTIGISGAVTGTATSFNGSANITINTTSVDATKLNLGASDYLILDCNWAWA